MKYTVIELPDNFKKGACSNCPFSYWDHQELSHEGWYYCTLKKKDSECPIKVRDIANPVDIDLNTFEEENT